MKQKDTFFKAGILLLSLLLVLGLVGCATFTADPPIITFQNITWKVKSAKIVEELEPFGLRPTSPSDGLLVVTFEPKGKSVAENLSDTLSGTFHQISIEALDFTSVHLLTSISPSLVVHQKSGGHLTGIECIFVIPKDTISVELLFPNSQKIEITLKH